MNTFRPTMVTRVAAAGVALLACLSLLTGCGGGGSVFSGGGGGGGGSVMRTLNLGPQNYDLLSGITPSLSQNWYTTPVVTPITINSTNYSDAIKGAVYADVVSTGLNRYHLGGKYSALGLAFGVTADEPDSPSWTAFRFWGDGRELATPHYVKKGEKRTIIVDTRGVQDFDLIAEGIPQTDGFHYVSTLVGWGDATLLKESGIKYLADLTPTSTPGWDVAPTPGTIWIDNHPYPHSVIGAIHKGEPASSCFYNLGGLYKTFAVIAGIDNNDTDTTATATFQVLTDGTSRASGTVGHTAEALMHFDVTGVNQIEVRCQVVNATAATTNVGWGMALVATNY